MHESGIAQDLFKIIKEKIKDLSKIKKIRIKVGKASGIDKEFLRHSFLEHIFPQNNLTAIELELIDEDVLLQCKGCNKTIDITSPVLGCPFCNSQDIKIVSGDKVYIESIETF